MKREYANCLGVARFWVKPNQKEKEDEEKGEGEKGAKVSSKSEVRQEYHLFYSKDATHNNYYALCCLDHLLAEAKAQEITVLFLWSDNGTHFHAAENLNWQV